MTVPDPDNREAERHSSLYAVAVEISGRHIAGKVRDHSDRGCRLVLDSAPNDDELLILVMRAGHSMYGDIAWRDGATIGVRFPSTPHPAMFAPLPKVDTYEPYAFSTFSTDTRRPAMVKRNPHDPVPHGGRRQK